MSPHHWFVLVALLGLLCCLAGLAVLALLLGGAVRVGCALLAGGALGGLPGPHGWPPPGGHHPLGHPFAPAQYPQQQYPHWAGWPQPYGYGADMDVRLLAAHLLAERLAAQTPDWEPYDDDPVYDVTNNRWTRRASR